MSENQFKFKRGDIYIVEENNEQTKERPWILVGANPINSARGTVLAIPLSASTIEMPPLTIRICSNNFIVCAIIDQVRALDKNRFIRFEGEISQHEMGLIDDGLRRVLTI